MHQKKYPSSDMTDEAKLLLNSLFHCSHRSKDQYFKNIFLHTKKFTFIHKEVIQPAIFLHKFDFKP